MSGKTIFISHAAEDVQNCIPLIAALDAWEAPYTFSTTHLGEAQELPLATRQALDNCQVFLRICTGSTARSFAMYLETGYFRSLQAEDLRKGKTSDRVLVNLILDPAYAREIFDNATLYIDTTTKARVVWLEELGRPLGVAATAQRLTRRSTIALGFGAAVTVLASGAAAYVGITSSRQVQQTKNKPITSASGQPLWTASTGNHAAMTISGQTIYVVSADGTVAYNGTTGHQIWSNDQVVIGYLGGSPQVTGGTVYVASYGGFLNALKASDGTKIWRVSASSDNFHTTPVIAGNALYVNAYIADNSNNHSNVYIAAYGTKDGHKIWQTQVTNNYGFDAALPSVAVAQGRVFVGSRDHNVYCLDASSGKVLWQSLTRGPVFATPTIANNVVYVGSLDGYVYALNTSDGKQLWSYGTGGSVLSSPTVAAGAVYFGSNDRYCYAVNARTGLLYWKTPSIDSQDPLDLITAPQLYGQPVIAGSTVYITGKAILVAYRIADGKMLWSYKMPGDIDTTTSPLTSGDLVYTIDVDGKKIFAINT